LLIMDLAGLSEPKRRARRALAEARRWNDLGFARCTVEPRPHEPERHPRHTPMVQRIVVANSVIWLLQMVGERAA
jgi:hypothetical protein